MGINFIPKPKFEKGTFPHLRKDILPEPRAIGLWNIYAILFKLFTWVIPTERLQLAAILELWQLFPLANTHK
jgi:hypothetical protein